MRKQIMGGLCAALIGASPATALAQGGAPPPRATGPSTATLPYLEPLDPRISFVSILTAGDQAGVKRDRVTPWRMVGVPDGLGAFDNGDGTITVLMNHELGRDDGVVRDHGFAGAFVSRLVIDKATLRVVSGADLIQKARTYNAATGRYEDLGGPLAKLCSGDLAGGTAFYDAASGLGYDGRIFLSGEERDLEGRPFAHFVTGPEAGNSYELAWLGNMAFENLLAYPRGGRRTIVGMTDDSHEQKAGQVYFYAGDKQAAGDAVERAGLAHGRLYGLKLEKMPKEAADLASLGLGDQPRVTLVDLGDVSKLTGREIEDRSNESGVTQFMRPEDGAWDTVDANRFYFNTTADFDGPSRLWALDFDDASHPERGGALRLMLNGGDALVPKGASEKYHMLDNMTVAANGQLVLQEDPGETPYLAHILQFDPKNRELLALARFDPALFRTRAEGGLTIDEETSGVIDVTPFLGSPRRRAFLFSVQPHYGFEPKEMRGEIVQGGQLVLMRQDIPSDR